MKNRKTIISGSPVDLYSSINDNSYNYNNVVSGTGVTALTSQQGKTIYQAINDARLAQASNPTFGEQIGEAVNFGIDGVTRTFGRGGFDDTGYLVAGMPGGLRGGTTVTETTEETEEVVETEGGDETVGGGETESGGGTTSRVSRYFANTPTAIQPSTSITDYLTEAASNFKNLYGDDPNYEQLQSQYLASIQSAYDQIVGEGGTLDQARAIADQQFGIAREQTERGFRQSQQQLAEQAFLGERQMQQQLAARGLGGTGLAQLGKVQQKIAEGGAASNLYRDFANSVQQLSLQEAQTQLGFAQAEADLNLALTRDLQDIQNRFRQERQAYSQWKGNTITGLADAIRTGNLQSYQMQMQEWERGLQAAQMLDQESRDSAAFQLDIIQETYNSLIANVQNRDDLDDEEKAAEVSRLQGEMTVKMDQLGSSVGLSPGDLASGIMGANQPPAVQTRNDRIFTDEQGDFRGVVPSVGRLLGELGAEGAVMDFVLGDPKTWFNNWGGLYNNNSGRR